MRNGDWMQTYSGIQFWPMDPSSDEISIVDIAHSLSNQCRYAGHCLRFYSVAQHSVFVSQIVPQEYALWGLLHDASEAYLVDLPRPIKRHINLGIEYRSIEAVLMKKIAEHFGLAVDEPACVREADDRIMMTEKRDIMGPHPAKWIECAEPINEQIEPWWPEKAEHLFLQRFWDISGPIGE